MSGKTRTALVQQMGIVIALMLLSGCYTTFETGQGGASLLSNQETTDDSSAMIENTTVSPREFCFWERDFSGHWQLRCYKTNYPPQWYDYYYRPWWFESSPGAWQPTDCHCPYHIIYQPTCEYCWYYCNYHHHQNKSKNKNKNNNNNKNDTSKIPDQFNPLPRPPIRQVPPSIISPPSSSPQTPSTPSGGNTTGNTVDSTKKSSNKNDHEMIKRPTMRPGITPGFIEPSSQTPPNPSESAQQPGSTEANKTSVNKDTTTSGTGNNTPETAPQPIKRPSLRK
ncbi:MAG: hypothetical protein JW795_19315 [Chitinivibrionales bacterium]|nr:hypothetical protein [Chitinivibrionales bacterium]